MCVERRKTGIFFVLVRALIVLTQIPTERTWSRRRRVACSNLTHPFVYRNPTHDSFLHESYSSYCPASHILDFTRSVQVGGYFALSAFLSSGLLLFRVLAGFCARPDVGKYRRKYAAYYAVHSQMKRVVTGVRLSAVN